MRHFYTDWVKGRSVEYMEKQHPPAILDVEINGVQQGYRG